MELSPSYRPRKRSRFTPSAAALALVSSTPVTGRSATAQSSDAAATRSVSLLEQANAVRSQRALETAVQNLRAALDRLDEDTREELDTLRLSARLELQRLSLHLVAQVEGQTASEQSDWETQYRAQRSLKRRCEDLRSMVRNVHVIVAQKQRPASMIAS